MRASRFFVLAALAWAAPAAAESAIVIVPDAPASEAVDRARAGVIEAMAERGVRLVRTPDGEPCADAACAAAMAAEAAVDWILLVRVEGGADGTEGIRVTLVPAEGEPAEATAPIEGDAHAAAAQAVGGLLEGAATRQHGFLMIRTDPPGARIEIDGETAGASPLRRMVAPGEHRVRVVPPEGDPEEQVVVVAPLAEASVEIDLGTRDEAGDDAAPPAGERTTRSEPSPFNWIIGGALAVAGIVTLISPLQTIAQHGECVDEIEDVGCLERVQFGAQSGVLLGIGVAAIVAAVIVDAVAPIRVDVEVTETAGRVVVAGRF